MPNRLKTLLFRFSPLARRVLPKPIQRFVLLNLLRTNHGYAGLYHLASRLCLQDEICPWLAQHYAHILFVGTSSYTYHYERLFAPDQYTTIDVRPNAAVWGARDHIIAPVEEIGRHRPKGFFDCVILNGVLGFGVNDVEHMRIVIEALHSALAAGGLLIVGWNTDLHDDPQRLLMPYFAPNTRTPWVERRSFPAETHVYDFFVRRPG
jgi:hypothetical protein